jgi:protease-4
MARKGTRLLLWVTAIGLVIVAAVTVAAVLLTRDDLAEMGDDQRWLYIKIEGLTDAPAAPGLFDDPADLPPLTTELTRMIRDAATDAEVPGLLLEVGDLGAGWAQAQELRQALLDYRQSGKRCIAWAEAWSNKEYYVGSACDELQVMPTGVMLVNGLQVTQTYYAGTLEKLDVHANFEHVGDFKSAVEPYQRTGPSEPAALAMTELLDSLYAQLVAGIAESRGINVEQAMALVDDPPLSPADALERGMVDRLAFRDQVKDQVEAHAGVAQDEQPIPPRPAPGATAPEATVEEERHELRHYREYLRDRRSAWKKKHDTRIAVLYAEGTIVNGSSGESIFGGQSIGDRTVCTQLRELREDTDIDAVVLRVNSPGGSGSASDAIWRELLLTRAVKPVVISMGDYAASGGYYISMGADHIVAEPGTLTGSIGVFGGKMNLSGAMAKLGLSHHTTQRGAQATIFSGMHDFDDAGRERFRRFLQVFYDTFVTKAAQGRDMSFEELHAVAQGRVWTGQQALERGLVDELGGLDAAVDKALELTGAGVPLDQVTVLRFPERKSFVEQLMEELEGKDPSVEQADALALDLGLDQAALRQLVQTSPAAARALHDAVLLQRILEQGQVAAMLPGHIEIR